MTKFESNPLHTHDNDISFVLFLKVPKKLLEEFNESIANAKPGSINFTTGLVAQKGFLNEHSFFPQVGDLFIFPNFALPHYVNHFQSDGERISVSGNIKTTNG